MEGDICLVPYDFCYLSFGLDQKLQTYLEGIL